MIVDFNKISWDQILTLFKILRTTKLNNLENIERRFNNESINFNETLEFFIELKFVSISENRVLLSRKIQGIDLSDKSVKSFLANELILNKNNRINLFEDYFKNFSLINGVFVFTPTLEKRLKYSGIRNFLLSLDMLDFNYNRKSYSLKSWISEYAMDLRRNLPYNKFIKQVEANNRMGGRAESIILKLERQRLKNFPSLQKEIEQVSLGDVGAGYDIKSYEILESNKPIKKYIEVKAVSEKDYHFLWSANEIDQARRLSENYFLYLLPINSFGKFDVAELEEIKNPYREVYKNQGRWSQKAELILFERNGHQKYQ